LDKLFNAKLKSIPGTLAPGFLSNDLSVYWSLKLECTVIGLNINKEMEEFK
jgi:hypothetical protein